MLNLPIQKMDPELSHLPRQNLTGHLPLIPVSFQELFKTTHRACINGDRQFVGTAIPNLKIQIFFLLRPLGETMAHLDDPVLDRLLSINGKDKVHPSFQVKPEVHPFIQKDRGKGFGRLREKGREGKPQRESTEDKDDNQISTSGSFHR
jgi:hypothetical protein